MISRKVFSLRSTLIRFRYFSLIILLFLTWTIPVLFPTYVTRVVHSADLFFHSGFSDNSVPVSFSRSAWYGPSAYPSVAKNESSKWLRSFVRSIGEYNEDRNTTLNRAVLLVRSFTKRPGIHKIATIVRFEKRPIDSQVIFLQMTHLTKARKVFFSRVECQMHSCVTQIRPNTTRLRHIIKVPPATQVLVLSFDAVDIYDVEKILDLMVQPVAVITLFPIRRPTSQYREDHPMELYDFFHKMYFQYDLVPQLSDYSDCEIEDGREECFSWIIWRPYRDVPALRYFPIAGNGSLMHELRRFNSFFFHPNQDLCSLKQTFGGKWRNINAMDGQWTICLNLLPLHNRKDCLIYSFGISYDWSFDDQMQAIGCTVHSFDPSINKTAHKRNHRHFFHDWGLWTDREIAKEWNKAPLGQILKKLGHVDKRISVMKIDVEFAEWYMLDSLSFEEDVANVDQLTLEIHLTKVDFETKFREKMRLVHKIEKAGFVYVHGHMNTRGVDLRDYLETEIWRPEYYLFVVEATFVNKNSFR